jgi:putative two-component system response regulator
MDRPLEPAAGLAPVIPGWELATDALSPTAPDNGLRKAMLLTEPTTISVTVVDDEPLAQDVLVRAARSWHYDCQAAGSAEQALQLLESRLTPIVVTDLRMPGHGGIWLVREIRRRWPQVAIIVVTAGHDHDAAIDCLNAGADHYFLKPIKLDEFRHALEMTARTWTLQQENERYRHHLEQTVQRQTRRIRTTYLSAIESLVCMMEERDKYTHGHSQRVRRDSLRLATAVGLSRVQCKQLSLAAKLHDIGKIGVPEAILNKPDKLTLAEYAIVQKHPQIGERVLARVIRNRAVLAAIRGHHERLDGTGYPDGLRGNQIPLLARIIAIADCFDALTTCRAYRDAMPVPEALDVLRRDAGTHFEPRFVEAFLELTPALPNAAPLSCSSRTQPPAA